MRFRKLRIAWSVGCGVACLLLIALWVRSYWCCYSVRVPLASRQGVMAQQSHTGILVFRYVPGPREAWSIETSDSAYLEEIFTPSAAVFGFRLYGPRGIKLPFWFLILSCAAFSAAPWLRWWPNRLSLRALLIATTLVAAILGAIVYAAK